VRIEYALPFRRIPAALNSVAEPKPAPQPHAPRIARLVALAHKLDGLVRSGAVSDYGALARLGHTSPARLSQLMVLLHLSPAIQERVLLLRAADARFVTELALRKIAREPEWDRQKLLFRRLLRGNA
jgi:hypothetical protein